MPDVLMYGNIFVPYPLPNVTDLWLPCRQHYMFSVERKVKNASPLQASGAVESRPYHRPGPVE
jgi:hypothetical protein